MDDLITQIALNAQALPDPTANGDVPDWVHLLPAGTGGVIHTQDGRGPWRVMSAARLIEASLNRCGGRIPIDEQHATDLAGPKGLPAPARGWIVEMEERGDGIWGRVEWNAAGRALVSDRAYRAVSPVILHDQAGRVQSLLRASLVNVPNMRGLVALNSKGSSGMDFMAKIAEVLGLTSSATEDEIMAALVKLTEGGDQGEPAMNAAIGQIAGKLGLAEDAGLEKVLNAIEAAPKPTELTELQGTVADLTTQLNALSTSTARKDAETYVDGEIARGRVGLKPVRERYVSLHMKDAGEARALIEAMPVLGDTPTTILPPAGDGQVSLNAAEMQVAAQLGMTAETFTAAKAGDKKEVA